MGGVFWDFYYFASKDHEQCPQKAWYLAKVGFLTGTGMTVWHLLRQHDFPHTAQYVGGWWNRYTTPLTASLVLGSTLTCAISRMRGNKDDSYNYLFGFLPTSVIWTALFRNSGYGAAAGVALATTAVVFKNFDITDAVVDCQYPFGRTQYQGAFGGNNWGDVRWMTPNWQYRDPGRRPID